MKSLFLRLLVTMWVTMTILVGIFAVIHAWNFPKDATLRWRRVSSRTTELRALQALDCRRTTPNEDCEELLEPLDDRDPRLAIFKDGVLVMGEEIAGAQEVEAIARASSTNTVKSGKDRELAAVYLDRPSDGPYVVVSTQARPSTWMFFIGPDTLPLRLGAIVAVTGLVAFALARWLSRPLRTLKAATQKLGAGDLTHRVSPELEGADSESAELGREMDRMAERIAALLEAQRRLLRDVSHELRSPLARLNVALELARRKSPAEAASALDRIEKEAERLDEMIGELLTLSRLEAGVGLENAERLDLHDLLDAVVADVSFEAEHHGAKVAVDATKETVELEGNAELLRRAIENVLRNAARYTKSGSEVRVGLRKSDRRAELVVEDRGPGVPDEALAKIFQPFYRVGDDRARKTGGAGIGLAIAQRAVELHGGTLEARNASEGGLVVTFTLPVLG